MSTKPQDQHPFSPFIRILGRGKTGTRSLDFDEAYAAMRMITRDQVEPIQLGAFLMLLRVKEESPEELAGFVSAVRESCAPPAGLITADLDWSSYVGKRQHHPWFLLAALALADGGTRVFMHGTSGHTPGRLYTESALQQLGIGICNNWSQVASSLDNTHFAYLPIACFSPHMQQLLQLKPLLGLRSVANSMARLLNPTSAPASVHSIFHPRYGEIHQQALQLLRQPSAAVFKGEGGEIERKPDANCQVLSVQAGHPQQSNWPRLLAGRGTKTSQLTLDPMVKLWKDIAFNEYGYQAVLGTLAIAVHTMEPELDQTNAFAKAKILWESRNRSRL
jgi:anthranilate phosphoribosyltransferase